MRYAFVEQERPNYAVALLCRVMEVSRSGFYAWRRRPKSKRGQRDEALTKRIRAIHTQSHGNDGAPSVHAELRDQQVCCGKKRVARLMRLAGLRGRRKGAAKRVRSKTNLPSPNNLLRGDFSVAKPDTVWLSDITYLRTREGWELGPKGRALPVRALPGGRSRRPLTPCRGLGHAREND